MTAVFNDNRKHDFYVVLVLKVQSDELSFGDSNIAHMLSGYTPNAWVFSSYLQFYSKIFNHTTNIVTRIPNVTYYELIEQIKTSFNVELSEDNYIDYDTVKLIDSTVFYNGRILEEMYSWENDYQLTESTIIPFCFNLYTLLNNKEYGIYFKDDFDIISKLMKKVCCVYLVILNLCEGIEQYEWFTNLKDDMKVFATKLADFPKPLEEYEYFDIFFRNYILLIYLSETSTLLSET